MRSYLNTERLNNCVERVCMCVLASETADAKTGCRILLKCSIVSPTRFGAVSVSGIGEEAIRKIIDRGKKNN